MALTVALACGGAQAATVEVLVEGIEPGAGTVYVALCQGGLSEAECRNGQDVPADGRSRRVVLTGIEPGIYAVAAYQDLDGNRRLDRTGLGLPLEPYGFSGEMGRARPDFSRARFTLREPGVAVRVRLVRALPPR
ncbi:DUF2141 domain-containing protein [Methylobacterium sp. Leaf106]|jgi:uncharacterized protein (DUF2141 family)|uniref:DUF2141 domain-containing protein n=1 Tax=Methylobacterium sp. Leaf106 TaxID=1736255 RepID=UPI0006FCF525|nr:DUF2141 domain-containing protein [Methylobacterium sp. Leaf106]KQP37737.1 hypothetical protein ASF34_16785 [Methylobacterium sp. Leaf106]